MAKKNAASKMTAKLRKARKRFAVAAARKIGITPRWRTVLPYATATSFIVACS